MFQEAIQLYKQKSIEIRYVIINVVVFLLITIAHFFSVAFKSGFNLAIDVLSVPASIDTLVTKPWTIFTYMFTHIGMFHLLSNMIWLYLGGRIFVDLLGRDRFIKTYWMGGLMGALFYLVAFNLLPDLAVSSSIMLGASASVLAVFIAITVYTPDYRVNLMFIGPAKLKYIALVFIILNMTNIYVNTGGHLAHLGGLTWGVMYALYLKKGRDLGTWFDRLHHWVASFQLPTKKQKTAPKSPIRKREPIKRTDSPNQKEVDRILDKVSKSGYDSLTSNEKQTLFNESKNM